MVAVFGISSLLISIIIYETTPLPLLFIQHNKFMGERILKQKTLRTFCGFGYDFCFHEKSLGVAVGRSENRVLYPPATSSLLTTQLAMKPGTDGGTRMHRCRELEQEGVCESRSICSAKSPCAAACRIEWEWGEGRGREDWR